MSRRRLRRSVITPEKVYTVFRNTDAIFSMGRIYKDGELLTFSMADAEKRFQTLDPDFSKQSRPVLGVDLAKQFIEVGMREFRLNVDGRQLSELGTCIAHISSGAVIHLHEAQTIAPKYVNLVE